MCGISGYIDFNKNTDIGINSEMIQVLNYRGPNYQCSEHYESLYANIGFGHARLSIIDLSIAGQQPMHYNNFTVVFNGEIYNYKKIRKELEELGDQFTSESDTEVILHAFEKWGVGFVQKLIGMFAIVIYDDFDEKVYLFRDRAGVKPLYYFWDNSTFLFASELKSLFQHPCFKKEIDVGALAIYFDFGYIPAPYSIFRNTYKLEPGKFIILDIKNKELSINTYWNIEEYYRKPKFELSYQDAKSQLKDLLISSCNYRMIADVPVGVFLSGGYDSNLVAAILQNERTEKLKTFTIGFEEGNNEAPFAYETSKYLGTDHTEYICTTKEAQAIIPTIPFYYDEPFADSSAIPTMLVSWLARKKVTVALSADGGDELFAGYTSYFNLDKNLDLLNRIPNQLKSTLRPILNLLSDITPISKPDIKHKLISISQSLNKNDNLQTSELFRLSNSLPDFYMNNIFLQIPKKYLTKYSNNFDGIKNRLDIPLAIDYQMYLQNDILTKVDRATMSVSLEGREPLLDHRLVEFVAQLPLEYKYNGIIGKRILKDIVHDYIPKELMERPKAGFSLPINSWLKADLKFLIDEYLNEIALNKSGLLNTEFILKQVSLFKNDKFYHQSFIWKLLMFQMWHEKWMQ